MKISYNLPQSSVAICFPCAHASLAPGSLFWRAGSASRKASDTQKNSCRAFCGPTDRERRREIEREIRLSVCLAKNLPLQHATIARGRLTHFHPLIDRLLGVYVCVCVRLAVFTQGSTLSGGEENGDIFVPSDASYEPNFC